MAKGANGDALHALLAPGHNLRKILQHLRVACCNLMAWIKLLSIDSIAPSRSTPAPVHC